MSVASRGPYTVVHFVDNNGRDHFARWLDGLDRATAARVTQRIVRVRRGNMGDCKPCRDGVYELRCNFGPGYRVYYAIEHNRIVILLSGGDKSRQEQDISLAVEMLRSWRNTQ